MHARRAGSLEYYDFEKFLKSFGFMTRDEIVSNLILLLCRRLWRCGHREGWAHVALRDSLQVVASEAQAGGQPVAGPPAAGKITASWRQRGILRMSGLRGHRHAYPGYMSYFKTLIRRLN